jgi:hypothetical protein
MAIILTCVDVEAHLNGGSAGATESSSRSGKVKSKKTHAEVLVARVWAPPPPLGGCCNAPPPLCTTISAGWESIAPININLYHYNAIKSCCGNAAQRGCVMPALAKHTALHVMRRDAGCWCSYGAVL